MKPESCAASVERVLLVGALKNIRAPLFVLATERDQAMGAGVTLADAPGLYVLGH